MKKILVWLKKPFLLFVWSIKRLFVRTSQMGKSLLRRRKTIYETHISDMLRFKNITPYNDISAPPWKIKVSGTYLVLGKYVSTQIYHNAKSHRFMEVMGFVLGKRFGEVFMGMTFVEVTNALHSSSAALPDFKHVVELKKEVASRYPDLEIVVTIHSHPNGLIQPSGQDKIAFLLDDHPNIIVSPLPLLWGSPLKRMAAYHHSQGKVRRIRIFETDKRDVELKDIEFREIAPSKEELIKSRELTTEIDFGVFKVWMVSHPGVTLKKLNAKLSDLFGKKVRFAFLYKDENWTYDPDLSVLDYFVKDGEHLVFPETFEEVKT
ncbi:MAG: Mov34/MPN/PAD-1 family protein [Candidatus Thermoplasmatota archaeon]|jgi:proteasome lid subunit RPN8/RPN11|nr:Mov34/MPN/PAD-1 family protein [Candidatus Thermoplasmatota archaeon]